MEIIIATIPLKLAEACNYIYTVFRHGAKSPIKTNNEKIRSHFRDPMVTAQITPGRTLRPPRAAIEDSLIPEASVEAHYLDLSEGKSGPSKDSSLRIPEHSLDLVAGAGKKCRTRNQGQSYLFRHNGQSVRAKEQTLEVALGIDRRWSLLFVGLEKKF